MEIRNCFWELDNIGKTTVEVNVSNEDSFSLDTFKALDQKYQYQVVKVPAGKMDFNFGLTQLGFSMIEAQLEISLMKKNFNYNDPLLLNIYDKIDFKDVTTEDEFQKLLERVTPGMFSTDRIALDPVFGEKIGCQRYTNWMKTEFYKQSSNFYVLYYDGKEIGFSMYREHNGTWDGLLGGMYPDAPEGVGLLTACGHFVYSEKKNKPLRMVVTNISANNGPVLSVFNHTGWKLKKVKYVFVKHNVINNE